MNFSSKPGMSGVSNEYTRSRSVTASPGFQSDAAVGAGAEADELRLALAHPGRADDDRGARPVGRLLDHQAVVQPNRVFCSASTMNARWVWRL